MKKVHLTISLLVLVGLGMLGACTKNQVEPITPEPVLPLKASLLLPANGEPCAEFSVDPNDASKILVGFSWSKADFAERYVLTIVEGLAEVFTVTSSSLSENVTLDRGKTYSWSVTAVNADGETLGDNFSFTTPGTPVSNYAPYTADISVTFNQANAEMLISWVGSDEDGDDLVYNVKVYEENEVVFEVVEQQDSQLNPISYTANTSYLIEVTSTDINGNFSVAKLEVKAP